MSNMKVVERRLLGPNSFYTIENDAPFSTASEMVLCKCDYSEGRIPSVWERKDFPFEVTDTRLPMRLPGGSMFFVRKVGHYAGKQCYVMSRDTTCPGRYICNYVVPSSIDGMETFTPPAEETKWLTLSTPWGRRGHIVCWNDEAVTSERGGQGFIKVYLPVATSHEEALALARKFVDECVKHEVAFGSPRTINCAIVRSILLYS